MSVSDYSNSISNQNIQIVQDLSAATSFSYYNALVSKADYMIVRTIVATNSGSTDFNIYQIQCTNINTSLSAIIGQVTFNGTYPYISNPGQKINLAGLVQANNNGLTFQLVDAHNNIVSKSGLSGYLLSLSLELHHIKRTPKNAL